MLGSQLEKHISQGGLKLTSLIHFHSALKLSWIKRLIPTDGSWQKLFEQNVKLSKHMFWELDIKSLLFYSEKHFTNTFWKELINIWRQYKFDYLKDIDPRCYPLWGTYFLTNQNLISRKYEFEQKGILYINDILTNTGDLYGYEEFTDFYNVILIF